MIKADEGVAYWMVNNDESKGMCEMYSPMADLKSLKKADQYGKALGKAIYKYITK